VVLRYPDGSTVVYDCGSYGRSDVGRWVAAPALWHWGVRRIDLLVASHADADHINGIPSLLERFQVGRVLYSPVLKQAKAGRQLLDLLNRRGIPHGAARAGDRVEVGRGNILAVLAPTDWTLRACPEDQN
jgi:competence protein ComEC